MVEVLDAPEPDGPRRPPLALSAVRELPYAAWVTIQTGCDNSCAFCIVPQVRGPEVSRPFDDIVAEVTGLAARGVTEVTLLGQNVNSYGRDLTRRRPLFAELLRAVGAVDGHPPGPLHEPAPEGPAARDHRGHGRDAGGVRAPPPARCSRGATGCCAPCAAATRAERYLERLAAARAAIDDLAVTTDIIVGFPGETDDDFERTLEVAAEAEYDSAYTFIFSPRPGTRAAAMTDAFVARRRGGRALRAAPGRGGALGARRAPGPDRPGRGGDRRRAERTRPRRAHRAGPGRTSSSTSPLRPRTPAGRAPTPRSASPAPRRTTCAASWCASPRRLRRRIRIPVSARSAPVTTVPGAAAPRPAGAARGAGGAHGVGQVRAGAGPGRGRGPRAELVSVDSMSVYRGMDIGTAKPTRGRARRRCPTTCSTWSTPPRSSPSAGSRPRRGAALGGDRQPRGAGPCSSAAPGSTCAPWSTTSRCPAAGPTWPPRSRPRRDAAGRAERLYARLAELDPAAAARMEPTNRRRVVRALEVTIGSGRPFSSFGPGLDAYPPTPFVLVGIRFDAGRPRRPHRASASDELLDAGLLDEVRALAARPGGLSRTARQALGYRELLAHSRTGVPLDEAVDEAMRRTRAFARRQWAWFRRDPRIHWLDPDDDLLAQLLELWDSRSATGPASRDVVGD